MYRVIKAMNHNCVLAESLDAETEVILLGKGIGFGKKVSERFEITDDVTVYRLQKDDSHPDQAVLAKSIDSLYFEISHQILSEAAKRLGPVDEGVLIPLSDHIAFAVERIKKNGPLSNPLTDEIKILFADEFKVAQYARNVIFGYTGVAINDDEAGFITIHLHTATMQNKQISTSEMLHTVNDCVQLIERRRGFEISKSSLGYSRLLSHLKYMIFRTQRDERIPLNLNEFMRNEHAETFELAEEICVKISSDMDKTLYPEEIGYLAIHIERVNTNP